MPARWAGIGCSSTASTSPGRLWSRGGHPWTKWWSTRPTTSAARSGRAATSWRWQWATGVTAAAWGSWLAATSTEPGWPVSCRSNWDLADGTTRTFTTGEQWTAGPGRISGSDPKHGERVDLRIPDEDWLTDPDSPARFGPAQLLPPHPRSLVGEEVSRVGPVHHLCAQRVWRAPSGRQLVDFGQNAAGVVRIRLTGPVGTVVRLTHSELLTLAGELDTDYLSGQTKPWSQQDQIILGGQEHWYQPWFTIHGFRYLEIDGLAEDVAAADVTFVALSSQLAPAGTFDSSDDRLTQLFHNALWSTRSNFTDTATDCPTRERSGWTGDIQAFASAATGLVDSAAFLRRFLRNVALEQLDDGRVPPFIPAEASTGTGRLTWLLGRTLANSTGWGDVAVLTPWQQYQTYGDRTVLERQYASMAAWVNYLEDRARTKRGISRRFSQHRVGPLEQWILDSGFHWGEWLRPGEQFPRNALEGTWHGAVVATAYFAASAATLSRAAAVLGHAEDARRYTALADNVRRAWQAAFLRPDGRIGTDRQDDYVRALAFDLLPAGDRAAAAVRLVNLIEAAGGHLGTGFLSTPLLLPVLIDTGHTDLAYRLLQQDTVPSWLYQVERGATTIWETWTGYTPDGRGEGSHNHYALGAVVGWLQQGILGITAAEPGYRVIDIRPVIGGGLTWASGTLETPFGTVASSWTVNDGTVELVVTVPAGATARVQAGPGPANDTGSGTHTFRWRHTTAQPPADPTPTTVGGGIVPPGRPLADAPAYKLIGFGFRVLPHLPRPLSNALLLAAQRNPKPGRKITSRTAVTTATTAQVPVTWLGRERRAAGTIVYLHGGAYIGGPAGAQWTWLNDVATRANLAGAAVLYRMPPRHPQPAALNDALAAITALQQSGDITDGSWFLAGDSAGGGLALAVTQRLRDTGDPLPAGIILTAPWVDLTLTNPELQASETQDAVLSRSWLRWAAQLYSHGLALSDPALSPLNGDLHNLPPVHLNVGTRDLFLPDVRRLHTALSAAGVPVEYIEQEGAPHTYPQTDSPEARWTIKAQTRWLQTLSPGNPT